MLKLFIKLFSFQSYIAPAIIAAGIGAAGSLLGGFMSSSSQKRQNDRNIAAQDYANRHSIQMRTADAKAAGIHPLYALGSPTMSTAMRVGDESMGTGVANASRQIGTGLEKMGQAKANNLDSQYKSALISNMDLKNVGQGIENEASLLQLNALKNKGQTDARNPDDLSMGALQISKDKTWSDAQKVEDRYGDLASWLYGIGVIGADGLKTSKTQLKKTYPKAYKAWMNLSKY